MAGFPPIDRLYLENPGLVAGAVIAEMLDRAPSSRLDLVPAGSHPLVRTRVHAFESLQEAADHLRNMHGPEIYYRGQARRHEVIYRGRIETLAEYDPRYDPLEVKLESLAPSFLRSFVAITPASWHAYGTPRLLDQLAPVIRAVLRSNHKPVRLLLKAALEEITLIALKAFMSGYGFQLELPKDIQIDGTTVPRHLLQLISLAQHYEYGSVMLDLTRSVDVAVWFASHRWNGALLQGTGSDLGVIYRFEADKIRTAEAYFSTKTPARAAITCAGFLGLADISNVGEELGKRPSRQAGASLFGTENVSVTIAFEHFEAMEVYTFPLRSITGRESSVISKEDLCPSNDPLVEVFPIEARQNNAPIKDEEFLEFFFSENFDENLAGRLIRSRALYLI